MKPPLSHRMYMQSRSILAWVTYAPLYCATSSPSTKTLSFRSISSAMASFSASRTVISFWPDAYPLLAIDGVRAATRKAGRKAGLDDESRREAGRRTLEAAIVSDVWESEGGRRGYAWRPLALSVVEAANFFGVSRGCELRKALRVQGPRYFTSVLVILVFKA